MARGRRAAAAALVGALVVVQAGCVPVVAAIVAGAAGGGGGGGSSSSGPSSPGPGPSSPGPGPSSPGPGPSSPGPGPSSPGPSSPGPTGSPTLVLTVAPASTSAGATLSLEVTLVDGAGQRLMTATDAVTVQLDANPGGATLGGTTTINAVAGLARFTDLTLDRASPGYTLRATASGFTATTSGSFTISPGAAARLRLLVEPTETLARGAMSPAPQVALQDAFGNSVLAAGVTVTLGLAGGAPGAGLTGRTATTAANGVATFGSVAVDRVGTGYTLVASATGLAGVTSAAFDVVYRLVYSIPPTTTLLNGTLPGVEVAVLDGQFSFVSSATAPITVALVTSASPAGATLGGTRSVVPSAGRATFSDLTLDRPGSFTLLATSPGSRERTSAPFPVTWRLVVTVPASARSGLAITPALQVSIEDALGNRNTAGADPVTLALSSNPAGGALGGTRTRVATAGLATFADLTLDRAGGGYVLAASAPDHFTGLSQPLTVTDGPPARLDFSAQPSDVTAGDPITPAVAVQVLDQAGNLCVSATGVQVAVGLAPGSPGTLSGTRTVTAASGVATFSDLSVDVAASGDRLVASSAGLTTATSGTFTVGAAAAHAIVFDVQPSSVASLHPVRPTVRTRLEDRFGNVATVATNTVTITLEPNGAGAVLSGLLVVASKTGLASFPFLRVDRAGTGLQLRATSPGLVDGLSSTFAADDTGPSATALSAPAGRLRGVVPLTYTLDQPAPARVDVIVEVEEPAGSGAWRRATQASGALDAGTDGVEGVLAGPGGRTHVFLWNSPVDLPEGSDAATVRVTPRFRGTLGGSATTTVAIDAGTSLGAPTLTALPGAGPADLAVGDLDRDGSQDLAVACPGTSDVALLRGVPGGLFVVARRLATSGAPRAVAVGDLDRDGDLDVVATSDPGVVDLFPGDGALGPSAVQTHPVGAGARGLAVGDLDRDGDPDLVVACAGAGEVSVLLRGAAGYGLATRYPATPDASLVALADLDRDGDLDVVAVGQGPGSATVLLGDGAGGLATASAPTATAPGATAVRVGDVDRDGRLDVVVLTSSGVVVLRGDGAGGLSLGSLTPLAGAAGLALADVDRDGDLDVETTAGGSVVVLRGDGGVGPLRAVGAFPAPAGRLARCADPAGVAVASAAGDAVAFLPEEMPPPHDVGLVGLEGIAGANANGIAAGDLDGDGRPDLVTAHSTGLSALRGTGAGRFEGTWTLSTSFTSDCAVADVDGDGFADVGAPNGPGAAGDTIYFGDGQGRFPAAVSPPGRTTGSGNRYCALVDLDGDGAPDYAGAGNHGGIDLAFNLGQRRFLGDYIAFPAASALGLVVEDVDGDDRPDLVVATYDGGYPDVTLAVFLNAGGRTFAAPVQLTFQAFFEHMALADVDRDGRRDLIVPSRAPGLEGIRVLRNLGGGAFAPPGAPTGPVLGALAPLDVDGDGRVDIVGPASGASTGTGGFVVALGDGAGTFTEAIRVPTPGSGSDGLACWDWDGDGREDAALSVTLDVLALVRRGSGGFALPASIGAGSSDALTGDWNRDGRLDLATAGAGSGSVQTVLAGPGGAYGAPSTVAAVASARTLRVADLDLDGDEDLVVLAPGTREVRVLQGDGSGGFTTTWAVTLPSEPRDAAVGDVDRDGRVDLVVCSTGGDSVVFHGRPGATFAGGVTVVHPASDALLLADLDLDGWLDLVVTDVGSTLVHASDRAGSFSSPGQLLPGAGGTKQRLFAGDVDHDGWPDLFGVRVDDVVIRRSLGGGAFSALQGVLRTGSRQPVDGQLGDFAALGLADLDRDGDLDLVAHARFNAGAGRGGGCAFACLGNGDGTFGSTTPVVHAGIIGPGAFAPRRSFVLEDQDQDGSLELVVTSPDEGVLRLVRARQR